MIKRFLHTQLERLAKQYPVVTLTGPRQSGKTTLCRTVFPKYDYVNLEDLDSRRFAKEDPRGFLAHYTHGVILDEIQRTPDLPSYIQGIVDEKNRPGMFILTGSQQFEVSKTIRQSLAGRTAIVRLLPLALGELYSPENIPVVDELLYRGFYPRIYDKNLNPTEALSFYVSTYLERDLQSFIQVREMSTFERFLKICATQVGQLVNLSKIGNDCGIDQKTVKSWISILEASYIIYLLQPHYRNFRKRLVKSPKLYFYDVGLAAFLLGLSNQVHLESHPLKGALFENFIITEFMKNRFNRVTENNLYFFRDHVGNEVDLVLDYGPELIPVEIKAGKTLNQDFFSGLEFYVKLRDSGNGLQFLVYGGREAKTFHSITIYPYSRLTKLFDQLPST